MCKKAKSKKRPSVIMDYRHFKNWIGSGKDNFGFSNLLDNVILCRNDKTDNVAFSFHYQTGFIVRVVEDDVPDGVGEGSTT
jgi:hypothetical protein